LRLTREVLNEVLAALDGDFAKIYANSGRPSIHRSGCRGHFCFSMSADVFTKNRDRLLKADVARKFLAELMNHKKLRGLLSDEHFSVDGTQIAAWASMKSFKAKDGSSDPPAPEATANATSMVRTLWTPRMCRPRIRRPSLSQGQGGASNLRCWPDG
jgi:stress-induced morphogen